MMQDAAYRKPFLAAENAESAENQDGKENIRVIRLL